jgi:uroporphyrin-III C-methyltransferase
MNDKLAKGKLILAGAGPGDPELITLKLQKRLSVADVIITDRLVNPAIFEHAPKDATIIFAGKQGYSDKSVLQEEINQLIIQHTTNGRVVVRLKGGDVAFFSNVLDELLTAVAAGLEVEIIPGITAASGASASTGIPLTARGYSRGVQFIAFNPTNFYSTDKWKSLAATTDTLVFYMAARNVIDLAELLLRYSKRPVTPLAVIEQATTPQQQVHITTLKNCADDFSGLEFSSPSLVVIGEVVNLYRELGFHKGNHAAGSVFPALINQ